MKKILVISSAVLVFSSCDWARDKAKETVNKAGEVAGKAGSEFASGVAKGVEKTFQSEVVFSDELKKEGLHSGRIIVHSSDSATDNIVTAYLIFDNDFDKPVRVKVISVEGQEYGRVTQAVKGRKGDAGYFDFIFDKRTNIDLKGKLLFE